MTENKPAAVVANRILKTELIAWKKLSWLQGDLKEITKGAFDKLKLSIRQQGFLMTFHIWEAPDGVRWILDGHHRRRALEALEAEGCQIPETLPANFVECKDKRDAASLVLIFSSVYANIADEQKLYEYAHTEGLAEDWASLSPMLDLPQIDLPQFDEHFMRDDAPPADAEVDLNLAEELNKKWQVTPGSLWGLGKGAKCPGCGKWHDLD